MIRRVAAGLCLMLLSACASATDDGLAVLGDFRLGYNIVQANDVQTGPFSRPADGAELSAALSRAIEARLGRYDGDGLYHIGVAIGAYVLAQPGVPLIYTPKSVLMFDINIYDNATGTRLNDAPHRIQVFEGLENIAPLIGSGIARDREAQLANLTTQGARAVERWLKEHPDWFEGGPGRARVDIDRETLRRIGSDAIAAAR